MDKTGFTAWATARNLVSVSQRRHTGTCRAPGAGPTHKRDKLFRSPGTLGFWYNNEPPNPRMLRIARTSRCLVSYCLRRSVVLSRPHPWCCFSLSQIYFPPHPPLPRLPRSSRVQLNIAELTRVSSVHTPRMTGKQNTCGPLGGSPRARPIPKGRGSCTSLFERRLPSGSRRYDFRWRLPPPEEKQTAKSPSVSPGSSAHRHGVDNREG